MVLDKLRTIYKLKTVNRMNSVGNRKESSAEHSWSTLILADYYLDKIEQKLDKIKVYELLMYHDLVEIESGDYPLSPELDYKEKQRKEDEGSKLLSERLPTKLGNKYIELHIEFDENKTIEARFANAIDKLDPILHEFDYKEDWKGWSKEFLLNKKEHFFLEFEPMLKDFRKVIDIMDKEGYFS